VEKRLCFTFTFVKAPEETVSEGLEVCTFGVNVEPFPVSLAFEAVKDKDKGAADGPDDEGLGTELNEKVDAADVDVLGCTLTGGVLLKSFAALLEGDTEFAPALLTMSLRADRESPLFCAPLNRDALAEAEPTDVGVG
jgi:hypothetical protein